MGGGEAGGSIEVALLPHAKRSAQDDDEDVDPGHLAGGAEDVASPRRAENDRHHDEDGDEEQYREDERSLQRVSPRQERGSGIALHVAARELPAAILADEGVFVDGRGED